MFDQVLAGEIAGPELPFLAPEELASDAKRAQNLEIRKKATFEANPAAGLKMSTTDAFQYVPAAFAAVGAYLNSSRATRHSLAPVILQDYFV